jgi:protein-S-isoprenylcysteine O-methyltransferase Ste14
MLSAEDVVALSWIVFVAVWVITPLVFRRPERWTVRSVGTRRRLALGARVWILTAIVVFALRREAVHPYQFPHPVRDVGAVICVAGIAVAVWARIVLGRSWGMPMSTHSEPTLIRTGPYAYVRHPIYSGLLLAMVGSALATGLGWLIALAVTTVYFVYALRIEESDLRASFPRDYPDYAAHTKRLIPFVY